MGVNNVGIESFRRGGAEHDRAPRFEWIGDQFEPTVLVRQRLAYRLEMIDSLRSHLGEGLSGVSSAGSELWADDAVLQPFQLSHLVAHSVAMALDALGTLALILRDPSGGLRIPLFGVYPVARQALEASAVGLWVVTPENPRDRRTRALRVQAQDAREEANLVAEFLKARPNDDPARRKYKAQQRQARGKKSERLERILDVAVDADLDARDVRVGVPSMRAVLDEVDASNPMPEASTRAVWQYFSGLAHPSQLRAIQASDLEYSDASEPGVSYARMTAKEEMVLLSLDVSLSLISDLLDALAKRALRPSLRWSRADLDLPPGWRLAQ